MASRLELRRMRDVPRFLVAALRIRRHFRTVDGGIVLALRTVPWRRTFWTLSVWDSTASLTAFVADPVHREVTTRYAQRMLGSHFVTWTAPVGTLPSWTEALAHLDDATDPAGPTDGSRRTRRSLLEA